MDVDLSHIPLMLDVSGDPETPVPTAMPGEQCACCGLWTQKLWQGARSGFTASHAVCTLCYLAGHLDSPTAAHGVLAYLPGMAMTDVHHLQRRALIAILGGTRTQRAQGKRVLLWLARHGREVEQAWGTTRAGEFAMAFQRLPPHKRSTLRNRLEGCALMLPADMFEDLSLLLPTGKTVAGALSSRSWDTYKRSDFYAELDPLG
ncbi:conjugal transfer protein TraT (plasmid) [Pseudomonas syringae]|uniref:conjugal transfer protein TraT n=1 Tax=Pseudomonas syringae TaxID=317 RepID=UPI00103751DC|nr:conjugal transfer protein TraT [Pseudomonas syringae]QBI65782.1 conjugal transfer protein TraT [Pseudomonas syringae]QBI65834.1 conjugal transfer protein TraT [Pseudomonas syringae]QBI65916.1 conjugal transfer protein TraT [Pseudomonas syringae]